MRRRLILLLILFQLVPAFSVLSQSGPGISVPEYIEKYKAIAIRKMQEYRIPASITMAQGILESSNGNSDLAILANNHFGIKCHTEWQGDTYYKDDDARQECFRKYKSAEESFEDHTRYLKSKKRYAFLFELRPDDYEGWAYGLKKAGYATNPDYPKLLLKIINENRLYELDKGGRIATATVSGPVSVVADQQPENSDLAGKEVVEVIKIWGLERRVMKNNRVKFVVAVKGDNTEKLARDLDMATWQIFKYNDLEKNAKINPGQVVYLQPKRRRAEHEFHIVKAGESMYEISQHYGVKLKLLYRKNRMEPGTRVVAGQKLWLKSRKPKGGE